MMRRERVSTLPSVRPVTRRSSNVKKRFLNPKKLFLLSVVLLLCYFLFVMIGQTIHYYQLKNRLAELEAELDAVKQENTRLSKEIEQLQDPSYLELVARRELGLVKPGEIVFWIGNGNDAKGTF